MEKRLPSAELMDEEPRPQPRSLLLRRALILVALLVGSIIIYASILARFDVSKKGGEVEIGAPLSEARVRLYLQPVQIDVVNESIQIKISIVPLSNGVSTIADHDFILNIGRGNQVEHIQITAGRPLAETTYEFDLHGGDVRDYPLDRYTSLITLTARERTDGGENDVPIHVTTWEAAPGFNVRTIMSRQGNEFQLQNALSRIGAVSFFALAIYAAMLVMMACGLIIGSLVFVGIRKIEPTLVSALGAIIFALPALRNAMPGAPPLGVRADILVFFWAELGAVIGLCLFIAAWAREGAQP
jgi:Domain of unknown function (DUF4436)